jgi:hypothetical protein
MRYEDPWYDALASGWGEADTPNTSGTEVPAARRERVDGAAAAAQVYVEVQRSEAFQEVRTRYRRFVIPAVIGSSSGTSPTSSQRRPRPDSWPVPCGAR